MSSETENNEWQEPTPEPVPGGLVATIRRLYFYLIASVSLLVGLSGLLSLLQVLTEIWMGDVGVTVNATNYVRDVAARSGGMLLVASPLFLIHWFYIQRLKEEPGETGSGIRKFFLYVLSAVTLGWGAALASGLLQGVIELLLGVPLAESEIWPGDWLFLVLGIMVNGALLTYFQRQLQTDGDWGREIGWAGTWRRLYQTALGLITLAMFTVGFGLALETLLQKILPGAPRDVDAYWARSRLSMGLAMLAISALLWRFNWRNWQRIIEASPEDGRTALRRLYLYGSVIISAIATLVPGAVLLRQLLLLLFGVRAGAEVTGNGLATALAFLPIGAALWAWHWRLIRREAARFGDSPESASVRRVYYYAVAAIGLILTWFGLVDILRVLLHLLMPEQAALAGSFWTEQLANGLSLLAVGAPVWAFHWRTVQSQARRQDAIGESERTAWPRRVYLYAAALAGALIILYYLTTVVYRFLLLLLGDPDVDLFGVETVDALARSIITLIFWLVSVLAIRQDSRMGEHKEVVPDESASLPSPALDTLTRRTQLEAEIKQLEADLAAARAALAQMEEGEQK